VQEQNVALLGEQLRTARNRFEAGAVSNFDVLRAEVEVANAQPALIRTRNAYRNAIESLRQALGYQGSEADLVRVPDFTGDLAVVPAAFTLVEALRTAREARPELRQLRIFVEAREAGVAIARAGFLPNVALVGGYQVRKSGFSDRFSDSLDGWTLGVQSNWAIFDGRATAGRVAQARSQVEQARLEAADFALGVEVEVRRAFSSWQEASELVGAAGKSVAQAEEALRLADARYGAGSATQLDQLQARTALTQARDNQLQANYSYNVAVAQLRRAMGLGDVLVAGIE
jgi:outer membrane protein TolC